MGDQALTSIQLDAAIFAACGTLIYLWLVAVTAPFVHGLRATIGAARGKGWSPGLAMALGLIVSVTAIPLAALFLAGTFAPAVGLLVVTSRATEAGALCGVAVFIARAALVGLPRFSARVELALVASAISWNPDEHVDALERAYRAHVLSPAPTLELASLPAPSSRLQAGSQALR
jgi:hypothetical protein